MNGAILGVGIVGSGPVTQAIHLPTLARLATSLRVTHIMDVNPVIAEFVAEGAGARWSTSLEDLLANPEVDVVAVCSPPQFHAEQVIAACRAGKRAVLCEKPFTTTVEEAERIAKVSMETGVPIVVGAMHGYDPGWQLAKEHLGDLVATSHTINSSIVLPPNERFEDFATEVVGRPVSDVLEQANHRTEAEMLHGAVMGLAIHDLPLVRFFIRDPGDVEVLAASFEPPYGYLITLRIGQQSVELRAAIANSWAPDWTLAVVADHRALQLTFTPSYVQAGSAVAQVYDGVSSQVFGPFDSNGYENEWRHLAALARGAEPAQSMTSLIEDFTFALAIADGAAAHVRDLRAMER